ncbi:hypothetical protein FG386_002603 [Cryptosporidium ryanae]|uniref:uncharacterized protein n=1 Tax=Cryptosporidium ryanae TaxID=515981 RepID=UPI00351A18A9|nr:hypothetical protein FG386_002603 [Cryptosporidium ryanae]
MYKSIKKPLGSHSKIYLSLTTLVVILFWLSSLFNTNWQQYIYETKNLGYIEFNLSLWGFTIKSKCNSLRYRHYYSTNSNNALSSSSNANNLGLEGFVCSKLNYFNGRTFGEAASVVCSIDKYQFPNAKNACYNFRMLNIGSLVMIAGIIGCILCVFFGLITFLMAYKTPSIKLTYAYIALFGCSNLIAIITLPIYYVNAGGSWIAINSFFSVVHFGYPEFTYKSPSASEIQFFWGYSFAILAFLTSILLPLFGCYFESITADYHDEMIIRCAEEERMIKRYNGLR